MLVKQWAHGNKTMKANKKRSTWTSDYKSSKSLGNAVFVTIWNWCAPESPATSLPESDIKSWPQLNTDVKPPHFSSNSLPKPSDIAFVSYVWPLCLSMSVMYAIIGWLFLWKYEHTLMLRHWKGKTPCMILCCWKQNHADRRMETIHFVKHL